MKKALAISGIVFLCGTFGGIIGSAITLNIVETEVIRIIKDSNFLINKMRVKVEKR